MKLRRPIVLILCLLAILFVVTIGALHWIETPAWLAFGWVAYLNRVLPKLTVDRGGVAMMIVCVFLAAVFGQVFFNWLWRGNNASRWRFKWTVIGLAMVLTVFAAGIAMTGVVHQTVWLARSPEKLVRNARGGRERADRVKCASNMRSIHQSLVAYAKSHGQHPQRLDEIAQDGWIEMPHVFICPGGTEESAPGPTTREWAAKLNLPKHCSYEYRLGGFAEADSSKAIVLIEHPHNHNGDGMNVCYADGHVEFESATTRATTSP